ncbi:hypothetical protein [Dyella nitratireducens]|uniref:YD repeat-containing protein n=1 Tax=Dyella nitratireducens TaxID=1849580 RepID=A0ABQ1GBW6_9GAMM|nr:hypothetical protein [Dyella nitratireducens]GGA40693.1 hypothetical protein GCM10010981_32380 [Dyella nitratireducens]GLQ40596.1 hypothetical protein GCM10007902_04450 [Dyella nitratireducens]
MSRNQAISLFLAMAMSGYAPLTLAQTQPIAGAKTVKVIKDNQGRVSALCKYNSATSESLKYDCGTSQKVPVGVVQWTYSYCDAEASQSGSCSSPGLLLSKQRYDSTSAMPTRYIYYTSSDTSGCNVPSGSCHMEGQLWKVESGKKAVIYTRYDLTSATGNKSNVTQLRNKKGVLYDLSYNSHGNIETWTMRTKKDGSPSANDVTTTFKYNNANKVSSITNNEGLEIDLFYDGSNKLTSIDGLPGNQASSQALLASHGLKSHDKFSAAVELERYRLINLSRMMANSYKYTDAVAGLEKLELQLSKNFE